MAEANIQAEPQSSPWTEEVDREYSELARKFEAKSEMTQPEVRQFLSLQLLKNTILDKEHKKEIERLKRTLGSKKSRSSTRADTDDDSDDEEINEDPTTSGGRHRQDQDSEGGHLQRSRFNPRVRQGASSHRSNPRQPESETGSDLDGKITELVEAKFYKLLDSEKGVADLGMIKGPKTGRRKRLDEKAEKSFKNECKNVFFNSKTNKSHSLAYVLSLHKRISEDAGLTSDASLAFLQRFLGQEAFQLSDNLRNSGMDISLVYRMLQTSFNDRISPYKASQQLDNFIDSPNLIEFTKVANHIHMLASNIHAQECEKMRGQSIAITSVTSLNTYLNKFYPRADTSKIRQSYLRWKSRNHPENPLESYFYLVNLAQTALEGQMPSYAKNSRRAPDHNRPRSQYQQVQEVREIDLLSEEEDHHSTISEADFDQMDSEELEQETASVLAIEPPRPSRYLCLLCNAAKHSDGSGGFYKRCNVYPGASPAREKQKCCGGRHPQLPMGADCKSPVARKTTPNTTRPSNIEVYR